MSTFLSNGQVSAAQQTVRFVLEATMEDGSCRRKYQSAEIGPNGSWLPHSPKKDIDALAWTATAPPDNLSGADVRTAQERVQSAIADAEAELRTSLSGVQSVRGRLAALAVVRG